MLQMKRHHLKYTFIWVLGSFLFYVIGIGQSYLERGFLTLAVLCMLPTALYMVRWLLLMPYKSLSLEQFEQIHNLHPMENGLLYDLLLIVDGKSLFIPVLCNELAGVKVYIPNAKDERIIRQQLEKLIESSSIEVYTHWMPFLKDVHPHRDNAQHIKDQLFQHADR